MGAKYSIPEPDPLLLEELEQTTPFNHSQLLRLHDRFHRLNKSRSGTITAAELEAIPELSVNPLSERIVAVLMEEAKRKTGQEGMQFCEFVEALGVFAAGVKRDAKLAFAFKLYDLNSDSHIDAEELFLVLRALVDQSLDDVQLQKVVDRTMAETDILDKDGVISFEEFKRSLFHADIESKMTIQF